MPKLSVTVITRNEAANLAAALESVAWADEIVVVDAESTDDTVAIARASPTACSSGPWPGFPQQKNHAAAARGARLDSVDRRRRARHAGARHARFAPLIASGAVGARLPHSAAHLRARRARFAPPTGIPDWQLRLYDRRRGRWDESRSRARVGARRRATPGRLRGELSTHAYRDLSHHLQTIDRYTTLAATRHGGARPPRLAARARPASRRSPSCATTCSAAASALGARGLVVSAMNAVVRVPEVREAVGDGEIGLGLGYGLRTTGTTDYGPEGQDAWAACGPRGVPRVARSL